MLALPNFLITCVPSDADAEARAQAIAATCEADLARLEHIFNADFQVGGRNQYGPWVNVYTAAGSPGGAANSGLYTDRSSTISIYDTFTPAGPAPDNSFVFDSAARFLFIAELSELLMDFTHTGWASYGSNGEALSIALATEFYPAGYYRTGWGPRVNTWLKADAPRPDFVASVSDDRNKLAYGCGVLFLNYLRHQRGIPLERIVQAGGSKLSQTYAAVTGNAEASAFDEFNDLIERHLPAGSPTTKQPGRIVTSDNIFPLRDPPERRVTTRSDYSIIGPGRTAAQSRFSRERAKPKTVTLKAGFACPEKKYAYWIEPQICEVDVVATAYGFLRAAFTWTVNGVDLPTHGPQTFAPIPGQLWEWEPDGSKKTTGSGTTITYIIRDDWNRSTLRIRNTEFVGDCELDVVVHATEAATNDAQTDAAAQSELYALSTTIEDDYYADRRRCNPEFVALDASIEELGHEVFIAKTLPDPPHDLRLRRILTAADRVQDQARRTAESSGLTGEQILRDLDVAGRLRAGDIGVSQAPFEEQPERAQKDLDSTAK